MKLSRPVDWNLPDVIVGRLGDSVGRQRAMAAEGHLLILLHEPPKPGVPERVGRMFWRDPSGNWKGRPFGDGIQSLKRHVTEFADAVDQLESGWQQAASATEYFSLLQAIVPLHRTARNLHTTLQEAREQCPADRDLINLRDRAGEIERAIELLHGDVKNAIDFTVAREAEVQSERARDLSIASYRLNLLAAIFLPVATLSAVFGMNIPHGLGEGSPGFFWFLVVAGIGAGVALASILNRRPPTRQRPAVPPQRRAR